MGRDIEAIKISGEDRRNYRDKLRRSLDVFDRMLHEHLFEADPARVGLEIELNLVDEQGQPSMRNADVLDALRTRCGQPRSASSTWRSTCRPCSWPGTRWPGWRTGSGPA